jgi:hypothetical protein
MGRVGTVANLNNSSTYDLLLVQYPDGFPEGRMVFDLGKTPRKITGLQKVAQLFLKILLTTQGSDPINPQRGTGFSGYMVGTNRQALSTNSYNAILDEVRAAEQQTKYILNGTSKDPSEQLRNVSVLGVDSTKDSIVLYMKLITMAGSQAAVALPFPQLDLNISKNG